MHSMIQVDFLFVPLRYKNRVQCCNLKCCFFNGCETWWFMKKCYKILKLNFDVRQMKQCAEKIIEELI